MVLDHAALKHGRIDAGIADLVGDETDLAVVDQKIGSSLQGGENLLMRNWEFRWIGCRSGPNQSSRSGGFQAFPRRVDSAEPQLWPLQIDQDRDGPPHIALHGAYRFH